MAPNPGGADGPTYLVVGHVTADLGADGVRRGGTVTYACHAAAAWGWRGRCVTVAAPPFDSAPADLAEAVEWRARVGPATTTFRISYGPRGERIQELVALAPALAVDDVPADWRRTDVLHIGPVAGEVPASVPAAIDAAFVGVTAQGWLREWGPGGVLRGGPWRVPDAVMAACDAMVVSEEDLAGVGVAAEDLAARVGTFVVTAGTAGAQVWESGRVIEIPAAPARAVDPTGAGDIFAATLFMAMFEGEEVEAAARLAASAAACAVEVKGAVGSTREQVLARLEA